MSRSRRITTTGGGFSLILLLFRGQMKSWRKSTGTRMTAITMP